MASYPSAVMPLMTRGATMDDPVTQSDFVDTLQDELRAVQQTLGVNAQGSFASVATRLATLSAFGFGAQVPGGTVDVATSATYDLWGSATITVPTWATLAQVTTEISAALENGASGGDFNVQTRIGANAGHTALFRANGAGVRMHPITLVDLITLPGTGSQTFAVYANRAAGTSNLRADGATRFAFSVMFRPS